MGELKKGSEAAKEVGVALAVLYNHIRAGRVTNRLAGGWPSGKGIEVDMDEVRAAVNASREKRSGQAPRAPRGSKKDKEAIQHQLEDESYERSRKRAKEQNATGENEHAIRFRRMEKGAVRLCPVNQDHGAMVTVSESSGKKGDETRWQCTHQAHDGRGTSTYGGFFPQTQRVFTQAELDAYGQAPAGFIGLAMLSWISRGQVDLAEELEGWLTEHDLPVWIPAR